MEELFIKISLINRLNGSKEIYIRNLFTDGATTGEIINDFINKNYLNEDEFEVKIENAKFEDIKRYKENQKLLKSLGV